MTTRTVRLLVLTPRTLRLSTKANCSEVEKGEAASQIRH